MKRWFSILLMVLFGAVFLVSAGYLIQYFAQSAIHQNEFEKLSQIVEQAQAQVPTTPPAPTKTPDSTGETSEPAPEETQPPETIPPHVEVTDPATGKTRLVLREYAELYTMNTDMVGWMRIEGTKVNYPVMQSPDRVDYYLNRGFDKSYSGHGCLYVKEEADVFAPSDNLTIYGHRMKDGSMFSVLYNYTREDFLAAHPTIVFDTLTEHHTYEVMAVFMTTASLGEGFTYHMFVDAYDREEFDDYVKTCKQLALYETGVNASYGDKLITLSTCEYSQVNGRLVVVAKCVD